MYVLPIFHQFFRNVLQAIQIAFFWMVNINNKMGLKSFNTDSEPATEKVCVLPSHAIDVIHGQLLFNKEFNWETPVISLKSMGLTQI